RRLKPALNEKGEPPDAALKRRSTRLSSTCLAGLRVRLAPALTRACRPACRAPHCSAPDAAKPTLSGLGAPDCHVPCPAYATRARPRITPHRQLLPIAKCRVVYATNGEVVASSRDFCASITVCVPRSKVSAMMPAGPLPTCFLVASQMVLFCWAANSNAFFCAATERVTVVWNAAVAVS